MPDPEFVSKTDLVNSREKSVVPMTIPSLCSQLGDDMEGDLALCPVRAIKYYLQRTEEHRRGRKKLFSAYKTGYNNEIHPNTISS